jgi:hypothetical protein
MVALILETSICLSMEAQESKYSVCNPILDFLETWYHRSNEKCILLTATRFDNHEHLEKLSKANL